MLEMNSKELSLALLKQFIQNFDETSTIGFPQMGETTKELLYQSLLDKRLANAIFLNTLSLKDETVQSMAYHLKSLFLKKAFDRNDLEKTSFNELLPITLKDAHISSKARGIVDYFCQKSDKIKLTSVFCKLFSKDKATRVSQYSHFFRLNFLDKCLDFCPKKDFSWLDESILSQLDEAPEKTIFVDPLKDIIENERIVYMGPFTIFKEKEGKLDRINQKQIKSLFELINIAINENLEIKVRVVSLDQLNEAIYFYRDSHTLKDVVGCLLNICLENLNQFGSKREHFNLDVGKLLPVDENALLEKTEEDLPIQNVHYAEEKALAFRYLSVLLTILERFNHQPEIRRRTIKDLTTKTENRGILRTLWIFSTEKDVRFRFTGLALLNLLFLSSHDLSEANSLEETGLYDLEALSKDAKQKQDLPVLQIVKEDYHLLFSHRVSRQTKGSSPLVGLTEKESGLIKEFIDRFIREEKAAEKNLRLGDCSGNKERVLMMIVEEKVGKCIGMYVKAFQECSRPENTELWTSNAILGVYLDRFDFFSQLETHSALLNLLQQTLIQKNDDSFQANLDYFIKVLRSATFYNSYKSSGVNQAFSQNFFVYVSDVLLPLFYEIHIDNYGAQYKTINSILSLLTVFTRLALKHGDEKLISLVRNTITSENFCSFLSDVVRKFEGLELSSTIIIDFLRWNYDLFMGKSVMEGFMETLGRLYDSALICNRTDNFLGNHRLLSILKLTHALVSKSKHLKGIKRAVMKDTKEIINESVRLPVVLKTTTVAWIVSLLDHRLTSIRLLSWNIISNYLDANLLDMFPSLVENAIANLSLVNEATGVLTLLLFFLTKVAMMIRSFE
jgi:hypothetical protein